jgi:hypothetical protein
MKRIIIYLSFVLACFRLQAQNLVLNPSFEDYSYCLNCVYGFPVNNWSTNPSLAAFFNYCNDTASWHTCKIYSLPYSQWAGYQHPRTGNAIVGILVGDTISAGGYYFGEMRNYIFGRLSESMQLSRNYCIEFYVNLANRDGYPNGQRHWATLAIDKFQLKFSNTQFLYNSGLNYGNGYNIVLQDSLKEFLNDTLGWHRIYNYHQALGGEKHFMFGNFLNNEDSNFDFQTNIPDSLILPSGVTRSYYFIDDVSITLIPEFKIYTSREKINPYQNAVLYSNVDAESITWYALPDTVNAIGIGDTLVVNPKETTTYAAKANQCRYESWDSVQITVTPTKLIGDLAVFNNITQNQFTIRYLDQVPLQMYLFNTAGQIVKALMFSATTEVDISDLASGIYYCRIMQGGEFLMTERVVKLD